jgi:hypothetical protein
LEAKLNRIVIKGGNYTDAAAITRLIRDAGVEPDEADVEDLALYANALGETVADDDACHVDLFVIQKGDESFLCANLYAIYLTFNNPSHTLPALRTIVDAADSMSCRAVDGDVFVIQFRFLI